MRFPLLRPLPLVAVSGLVCGSLFSQTVVKPAAGASKVEPGLEVAVDWKWWVAPSEKKEWGMPLPEALRPKPPGDTTPGVAKMVEERPETYEVVKGDAIVKIAKKFDMSAAQLKQFNDLKDDRIKIGQILRIPTPGQLLTLIPPPPPQPPAEPEKKTGKKKNDKQVPVAEPVPEFSSEAQLELETVRLQVFLDREMFSPGMIDGRSNAAFQKICEIYQRARPDSAAPGQLKLKAEGAVKEPYTRYNLRADDFKFISPPKAELVAVRVPPVKKNAKAAPAPAPAAVTIDELVAADFLGYSSAWEFVAERFHCDEEFLHHINPQIKGVPVVGTEFQVPDVHPFEIEKALDAPLQPAADPQKPVTAAVVLVSRLEISCEGKLVAVMPLASARPGLHGRGSWTVLDAIPQPRMATKREPRETPKEKPAPTAGEAAPAAVPVVAPPLEKEQYLAPGPNNPVGVIWINLAKAGGKEPLAYGLHGTGIPSKMATRPGIGGFRLSNWDIARAARLIPAGTVLQWKAN